MGVEIERRQGLDVPEEWRTLQIPAIWIVSINGYMMGVFFSAEEAGAYAELLELRLEQELELDEDQGPGIRIN
ncbi:hypothetical protein [Pseudomonas anguilliseptica]|uniref:Uncharacterized protein n=1 Tax=Pseudomonas anguilliseptica TaxID=53406 RepID=A0A1H4TJG0_PSEAG|nr:hypothetical protein [Pseudomonas anguilliseptica]SEC56527.1 hypothetical protein SAMN05421553_1067 [Pseudomonas anguilliseptica]